MNRTPLILAAVLAVCASLFTDLSSAQSTKVALHATQEEINIWNQRRVNGPYKDEWDQIKSRADGFVATPQARWAGQTTNACFDGMNSAGPDLHRDEGLRDAAFAYLVLGTTAYRTAARDGLFSQTAQAGTDFSNSTRWCSTKLFISSGYLNTGVWLRRLLYAYSYIRADVSAGDRATLDAWFLNAANHVDVTLHNWIAARFPNRLNDNYTCSGSSCPGAGKGNTHFGGFAVSSFHTGWTNIQSVGAAFSGAVGILLNNTTLKNNAKRYFQEWLKYGVFPGGVPVDQYRWNDTNRDQQDAYSYNGHTIGSMITLADHFARSGDISLYEYTTTTGLFGSGNGTPKSLLTAMLHFAGQTNGTILHYGSTTGTTDSSLIIDKENGTKRIMRFVTLAPANIYYNNPTIKTAYTTSTSGSWTSGGFLNAGGDWGTYPAIRFMFGQLEGKVSPYPIAGQIESLPFAPSSLDVSTGN